MVLVDIEVAVRGYAKVEGAMARDELEHVIEKSNARSHLVSAVAVQPELERNMSLHCAAVDERGACGPANSVGRGASDRSVADHGAAHRISSNASMHRLV